jgi:iron complex transport system ATP-binding protein
MTSTTAERSVFRTDALHFRYQGAAAAAIDGVAVDVPRGAFYAIVGPNGSGKSTLLRLLLGRLRPDTGSIEYEGRAIGDWPRRDLARRIGVVPQEEDFPFPITVRELVGMGRYPHLGAWRGEGAADRAAIQQALVRCDVEAFTNRAVTTLSGGERQRARIARALAQQPATLVLDEPTSSLDIAHEMALFELLAALRAGHAMTVLVVTHNLNLAARYADRLLLLDAGRTAMEGTPAHVLTADVISRVYRWPVRIIPHTGPGPDSGAPQIVPLATGGAPFAPDTFFQEKS